MRSKPCAPRARRWRNSSNETREQFERLADGDRAAAHRGGRRRCHAGRALKSSATATWAQLHRDFARGGRRSCGGGSDRARAAARGPHRLPAPRQRAKDASASSAANPDAPMARRSSSANSPTTPCAPASGRVVVEERSGLAFLRSEELQVIGENLHIVAREQERLAGLAQHAGDDKAKWASLANRMRIVLSETRSVEQLMTVSAARGGGDRLKQAAQRLERLRLAIERTVSAGEPGKALTEATRRLTAATLRTLARRSAIWCATRRRARPAFTRGCSPNPARPTRISSVCARSFPAVGGGNAISAETRAQRVARRWVLRGEIVEAARRRGGSARGCGFRICERHAPRDARARRARAQVRRCTRRAGECAARRAGEGFPAAGERDTTSPKYCRA